MRICKDCNIEKPLTDYYKNSPTKWSSYCKECDKAKAREYYHSHSNEIKKYRLDNKKLRTKQSREWYRNRVKHDPSYRQKIVQNNRKNKKKYPQRYLNSRLKHYYGIDIEQYNKILERQNFSCAICRTHKDDLTKSFHVDHCHKTGLVRGLLCNFCNPGLGLFFDNPDFLIKAAEYLKESNK